MRVDEKHFGSLVGLQVAARHAYSPCRMTFAECTLSLLQVTPYSAAAMPPSGIHTLTDAACVVRDERRCHADAPSELLACWRV
jgi:hypothetical protein